MVSEASIMAAQLLLPAIVRCPLSPLLGLCGCGLKWVRGVLGRYDYFVRGAGLEDQQCLLLIHRSSSAEGGRLAARESLTRVACRLAWRDRAADSHAAVCVWCVVQRLS